MARTVKPEPENTPFRVALVASSFHPYVGGVEAHVGHVAQRLIARGYLVEVWTVDRGEHLGLARVDGVVVRYLPTPLPARDARSLAHLALRFPGAWRQWSKALREFSPDVLHVQCFGPNGLYALALNRRYGTRLAVTSHGETFTDDASIYARSALLRRGLRSALQRSSFVTGCSDQVLNDLHANFGLSGGTIVGNGVEAPSGSPRESPGVDDRTFVAVGRLGRTKGFDLLLEAFARASLDPDIRLVIVGDGPDRAALEQQRERLGLTDRVLFAGMLDPALVAAAMTASLAVVVPSRRESFGIVVLEAWFAKVPLIVTRRVGAPVRDGVDAVLVDPEDPAQFAQALQTVSTDEALRASLATAGAARVVDFTWDEVTDRYIDLYDRLEERVTP